MIRQRHSIIRSDPRILVRILLSVLFVSSTSLVLRAGSESSPGPTHPASAGSGTDESRTEYDRLYHQAADHILKSEWTAAYEDLNRAIALDPDRYEAYYVYGRAHLLRDEPAAAEQAFRKSLETEPDLSASCYELARLMVLKGDLNSGLEFATQAVTLTDGRNWKYQTLLGELKAELGDRPGVVEAFDNAIRILEERCTTIEQAIRKREQEEVIGDLILDVDYYVVYQEMIPVPNVRYETRHRVAPSDWVDDLARHKQDLAEVTERKVEVLEWMEARGN
ncbi:MAG: hypothetical protein R3F07_05450 [Opitutaceae bacterium]